MQANIRAMTVAGFVAIFVGGLLPGGALNRQLRRTDAEASLLKRGVEGLLLSSATDWNGSVALVRSSALNGGSTILSGRPNRHVGGL